MNSKLKDIVTIGTVTILLSGGINWLIDDKIKVPLEHIKELKDDNARIKLNFDKIVSKVQILEHSINLLEVKVTNTTSFTDRYTNVDKVPVVLHSLEGKIESIDNRVQSLEKYILKQR